MAKKAKKRSKWFWALWLLVAVAGVSLFLMPISRPTPKMHWRVPVHVAMPDLPKGLPSIPENLPDLPDIKMPDVGYRDVQKFGEKVADAISELPSLPYEADHPTPPEPLPPAKPSFDPEPPPSPPPVPVPQPEPSAKGYGRIAIIIDDVGLVRRLSERAARLPAPITLAYLPYAPNLVQQAEAAQAQGHDLMLHLPMEPIGHENPGPDALFSGQSEEEWRVLLQKSLQSFDGFIGVNNHMGSKLTTESDAMNVIGEVLYQKGLFFVDSRTSSKSIAEKIVRNHGVKAAGRDVFIDDTQTPSAVQAELAKVEQIARNRGHAIAIGHPHVVTLQALERWIPEVQARGFEIIPVKELVH